MTAVAHADARPISGLREQWATRAIFLAAGTAMAAWAPLVPFAKTRLGVDEASFGLLLLCLGLGSIIAMPVTGVLATRFGCRRVMVIATLILAATIPLLAVADSVPLLALALILFGGSVGTVDVSMNIQAVIVERHSGRSLMSGFHGLFSVGGIVGAGGVSLLLGLGVSPLLATIVVAVLLLAILVIAQSGFLPYGNAEAGKTPLFVVPQGIVVLIGVLCFITFMSEGAILDWSALFMIDAHAAGAGEAGLAYTVFALAMTTGRLTGDMVVQRLGGVRVMVAGGLLAAAGFAVAVLAPNQTLSLLGFLAVGLGAANIVPVLFSAAGRQTLMPPSLAIAAITTLGYLGILAGPAMVGFVAQASSLGTAFFVIAALMLGVAACGWVARK